MAKTNTAGPTPDAEGAPVPETLPPPPPDHVPVPLVEAFLAPRTIEEWRDIRKPEAWAHEAAKSLRNWPLNQVVTADQYDSAIKAAHTIEVS